VSTFARRASWGIFARCSCPSAGGAGGASGTASEAVDDATLEEEDAAASAVGGEEELLFRHRVAGTFWEIILQDGTSVAVKAWELVRSRGRSRLLLPA
jgi:hypothetical protein